MTSRRNRADPSTRISGVTRLLLAGCLVVRCVTFAFAGEVSGAFGLAFGVPLSEADLAGQLADIPYMAPPANIRYQVDVDLPVHLRPRWHVFIADELPALLRPHDLMAWVQVDAQLAPIRIVLEIDNCNDVVDPLVAILAKKYDQLGGGARDGFLPSHRFGDAARQVDVHCHLDGTRTVLDYVDVVGFDRWHTELTERIASYEKDVKWWDKERNLALGEAVTLGPRGHLLGAFGVAFDAPLTVAELVVDEEVEITVRSIPTLFRGARFKAVLDPQRRPIQIKSVIEYATVDEARSMQDLMFDALHAKYGVPMKERPRHRVFNVHGDLISLRWVQNRFELTVANREGLRGQRERKETQVAKVQAALQRQWDEDTRGL